MAKHSRSDSVYFHLGMLAARFTRLFFVVVALGFVSTGACNAKAPVKSGDTAGNPFLGEWMLTLERGAKQVEGGLLTITRRGTQLEAHLDGGLTEISLATNQELHLTLHNRAPSGLVEDIKLIGTLQGDAIRGLIYPIPRENNAQGKFSEPGIVPFKWGATRAAQPTENTTRNPAAFDGIWWMPPGGISPAALDQTPVSKAITDAYHPSDAPSLRCVAPGLTVLFQWPDNLIEIGRLGDHLVMLYEGQNQVRRIYLAGSDSKPEHALDDFEPTANGFSVARWEAGTLIVTTDHLKPHFTFVSGGLPVSENARIQERYSLSADGNRIEATLTLEDPDYYRVPVVWRRHWERASHRRIVDYECDPDSFYRQLYENGEMDKYWERIRHRF